MKNPAANDPLADELCTAAMNAIRAMKRTFPEELPTRANDRARLAVHQYRMIMTLDLMSELASMLHGRTLRSIGREQLPPGRRLRYRKCVLGRSRRGKAYVTSAHLLDLARSGHPSQNGAGTIDPPPPEC